jgi:predicted NUDIX family NTP pyrophosphohydrolase
MVKKSAGLLLYRFVNSIPEFLLVHPGGPYWKNKDIGAWSVPKGEFTDEEEPLDAAIRELKEETGFEVNGKFIELSPLQQKSGKIVFAWAIEADADTNRIKSNLFELEWPPRSGKKIMVPEVDKAEWFSENTARQKIIPGQAGFITELIAVLKNAQ